MDTCAAQQALHDPEVTTTIMRCGARQVRGISEDDALLLRLQYTRRLEALGDTVKQIICTCLKLDDNVGQANCDSGPASKSSQMR